MTNNLKSWWKKRSYGEKGVIIGLLITSILSPLASVLGMDSISFINNEITCSKYYEGDLCDNVINPLKFYIHNLFSVIYFLSIVLIIPSLIVGIIVSKIIKSKKLSRAQSLLLPFNLFGIIFSAFVFWSVPDLINKIWSGGIPFIIFLISIFTAKRNFKISVILTLLMYILLLVVVSMFVYVFFIDTW